MLLPSRQPTRTGAAAAAAAAPLWTFGDVSRWKLGAAV